MKSARPAAHPPSVSNASPGNRGLVAGMRRTIRERGLLEPGERVLVAVSGGPDSSALAHGLWSLRRELEIELVIATVDHGLRPESPKEVATVERLAARLALPFHALAVDVGPGHSSLPAKARDARYAALLELAARTGCTKVAVGHNADDQAETVIDRLLRGTGLRGLSAVQPRRADGVIRPLLDTSRADVREYVARQDLEVVDDPTNRNTDYRRARIRHGVLPVLRDEEAEVVKHLADLADDAREMNDLVTGLAQDWIAQHLHRAPGEAVHHSALDPLRALPSALRSLVLALWTTEVTGSEPGRAHRAELGQLLRTGRGTALLGHGWAARVDGETLVFEKRDHWPTRANPAPCAGTGAAPEDSCDGSAG